LLRVWSPGFSRLRLKRWSSLKPAKAGTPNLTRIRLRKRGFGGQCPDAPPSTRHPVSRASGAITVCEGEERRLWRNKKVHDREVFYCSAPSNIPASLAELANAGPAADSPASFHGLRQNADAAFQKSSMRSGVTPAASISRMAAALSPGWTSTPRMASVRRQALNPRRTASSAVHFTQ